jgi:hypothetical protein
MTKFTVRPQRFIPPLVETENSTQVETDFSAVGLSPLDTPSQFQFSNLIQENKMSASKDSLTSKDNPVHVIVIGTKGEATIVFDNPGVAAASLAAGGRQITPSLIYKNPA